MINCIEELNRIKETTDVKWINLCYFNEMIIGLLRKLYWLAMGCFKMHYFYFTLVKVSDVVALSILILHYNTLQIPYTL